MEHGRVKGWAFDSGKPGTRLSVELLVDGRLLETVTAGQFRPDLLAAGVGDGYHAFEFALPGQFFDERSHVLEARVAGTGGALEHSPRTGLFPPPLTAPGTPPAPAVPAEPPPDARTLPESALASLSVVIPTSGAQSALERTLRACAPAARNLDVEFVVVDYQPDEHSAARLRVLEAEIPRLRWVAHAAGSPGEARNHGVPLAAHALILFLAEGVAPVNPSFFEQHIQAHRMLPGKNVAVLGTIRWANQPDERVSFLMAHLQGAGGQQFGFHSLVPYSWLDWRFFHPQNISFKRAITDDWETGGYRAGFPHGELLEDAELAYRLESRLEGGLAILYHPNAAVSHQNTFTVRQFLDRQFAAGLSARTLFASHPGAREKLGLEPLDRILASPQTGTPLLDDLLRMIEGAKSWGPVIESQYRLGSQNWHADLLNAIFELSYLQGYASQSPPNANHAAAYRYCLERFQEKLATAAAFEVFGRFPNFTLT